MTAEASGSALPVVLADPWAEVEEHAEGERAGDAVHDARRDRVVEAEARHEPAARAPAPGRVHDPHRRAEDRGQDQVRREADPLDDGARHDRARRPREEEECEPEDEADVVAEVRAEADAPGRGQAAEPLERLGAVVPRLGPALLEAAVDVPAEVVEGRCDDGDRQDVLHRRRHDVLAPHGATLVGHEAHVDEPHDDDGVEVVLLCEDRRVERERVLDCLQVLSGLCEQRANQGHRHSSNLHLASRGPTRRPYEVSRPRSM